MDKVRDVVEALRTRIGRLRDEAGLSYRGLARALEMDHATLARFYKGETQLRSGALIRLDEALPALQRPETPPPDRHPPGSPDGVDVFLNPDGSYALWIESDGRLSLVRVPAACLRIDHKALCSLITTKAPLQNPPALVEAVEPQRAFG